MNTSNATHAVNNATDNAANALQQLRDIHVPVNTGWWPPAPGWWFLAAAGLLCLMLALRWWQRWQRRNRRWQAVQRELRALQTQPQSTAAWFGQLNALLKRAARDSYPQQSIAALSGDDWVAFLQDSSSNTAEAELVKTLVSACWQRHSNCDPQQALAFAGRWLQNHKKHLRGAP